MKTTMKKLEKELLWFVENDNFKDLFVEKTHKLVTNTDERDILEITLKTLKEKDHPFDPDRFDFEQVGNYDGKWYYKGTKKEVSDKHLQNWLGEFEYKDLSSDESDKHWNTNTVCRVWLSENKSLYSISAELQWMELMNFMIDTLNFIMPLLKTD